MQVKNVSKKFAAHFVTIDLSSHKDVTLWKKTEAIFSTSLQFNSSSNFLS